MSITNDRQVEAALNEFKAEPDRWLRKMLAQAILAYPNTASVCSSDTRAELGKALECRIS
jgi:hypothetical protein